MSDLSQVYAKDANIVARKVAGEMVLVPIRKSAGDLGSIYTLNKVQPTNQSVLTIKFPFYETEIDCIRKRRGGWYDPGSFGNPDCTRMQ